MASPVMCFIEIAVYCITMYDVSILAISNKKPSCRQGRRATAYTVPVAVLNLHHPRSITLHHLKEHMRFPISSQQQPWPYLTPFSHNTYITHRWMDGRTTDRSCHRCLQHNCSMSIIFHHCCNLQTNAH